MITWVVLLLVASTAALDPTSRKTVDIGLHDPVDGAFEVPRLPGYDGELPSRHRAGYVTVAPDVGRRLYYYLVGSESPTADDDPLVIWLTGGPGCSSLDAFTYENGPFIFELSTSAGPAHHGRAPSAADVSLRRNPYSWSREAHVLYVDSPAGTGMSYSLEAPEDGYYTDDHQTVDDLLALVLGVLSDVPDMRGRDVYIAGESYGGVYVPLLAERILRHNKDLAAQQEGQRKDKATLPNQQPHQQQQQQPQHQQQQQQQQHDQSSRGILRRWLLSSNSQARSLQAGSSGSSGGGGGSSTGSSGVRVGRDLALDHHHRVDLVGYMVGNGVTDDQVDGDSLVPYAWDAGLLDKDTHDFVNRACNGSYWDVKKGTACWDALDVVDAAIGDINPYDTLSPCFFPRAKPHAGTAASEAVSVSGPRAAWPRSPRFPAGQPVSNWWTVSGAEGQGALGVEVATGGAEEGGLSEGEQHDARGMLGHTIPCADRRAALAYYNDPEVRRAIHAAPHRAAGRWEPCSDVLHYTHTAPSMIPVHRRLIAAGLRGLVFSGLQDYVVPFTGSRKWVAGLGLPTQLPWRPWKLGRQVAGHAVRYRAEGEGPLTYATVIGAGHMVPQTRPRSALALLRAFLRREV